jgi:hypothetical protein
MGTTRDLKNLVSQMESRRSQRSTSQHRSRSPSLARSPAPYRTRSSVRYVRGCPGNRVEVKVPVAWSRRWSSSCE